MKNTIIASAIALAFAGSANAVDLDATVSQLNSNNYVHADAFVINGMIDGTFTEINEVAALSAIASAVGNSVEIKFEGPAVDENASDLSITQNNGTAGATLQYSTAHVLGSKAGTEGVAAVEGVEATEGTIEYVGPNNFFGYINPHNYIYTPGTSGVEAVEAVDPVIADINAAAFSKGNAITVTSTEDATHELEDYTVVQVNGTSVEDMTKLSAQNAYSTVYNSQATGDINSAAVAVGNGVDVLLNNHIGDEISQSADTIFQTNVDAGQYAESWISTGESQVFPDATQAGGDLTSVARAVGNDIKIIALPDDFKPEGGDSHELETMSQTDTDSYQVAASFVGGYTDTESVQINYYEVPVDAFHYNNGEHTADTGTVIVGGDSSSVAQAAGNSMVLIGDAIVQDGTWSQTATGQGTGDYYHNVPLDGSEQAPDNGFKNVETIAKYVIVPMMGVGESAYAVTQNAIVGGDAITYADAVANTMTHTGIADDNGDLTLGGSIDLTNINQTNTNNVELGVALSINNNVAGDLTTVAKAGGNRLNVIAGEVNVGGTISQSNTNTLQLSYAGSGGTPFTGNVVGGDLTVSTQSIGNAINLRTNDLGGTPTLNQVNTNASQYSVSMSRFDVASGDLTSAASSIGNSITFASLVNGG